MLAESSESVSLPGQSSQVAAMSARYTARSASPPSVICRRRFDSYSRLIWRRKIQGGSCSVLL